MLDMPAPVFSMALLINNLALQYWSIDIENGHLKGIVQNGTSFDNLDLSNRELYSVNEDVFRNLSNLKVLDLSYNKLKNLPSLKDLLNLKSLNLANNELESGNFYAGLDHLETLNISNNPLQFFEPGHFFGLTKQANILTHGLNLSFITATIFENPLTPSRRRPLEITEDEYGIGKVDGPDLSSPKNDREIEVCIENGHLKSVEILKDATSLLQDCHKIELNSDTLFHDNMGIKTFESGWYKLQDQNVRSIVLSNNGIAQFTKELLNDLPAGIVKVHLTKNSLTKLKNGIIENSNSIDLLDLRDNCINEIEKGALQKLNLTEWLLLDNNYLVNTEFLDSLPPYIQAVSLDNNHITELSSGDFTEFKNFKRLSLAGNEITGIKGYKLRGFSTLTELSLRKNRLRYIESEAFGHLKNLLSLDLSENKITHFEVGSFLGLNKTKRINLDSNRIEEILSNLLAKMPNSLETLTLADNKIKTWIDDTVTARATNCLPVHEITNLPKLRILDLHKNLLDDFNGKFFKGLKKLMGLSLSANYITVIKKGAAKYLYNLYFLDLSLNPITKLKNGALHGIPKDSKTIVRLDNVPLELIQGGLFDNV